MDDNIDLNFVESLEKIPSQPIIEQEILSSDVDLSEKDKSVCVIAATTRDDIEENKCCRFCSGATHPRNKCPARHTKCSYCSKPGHFRCACEKLSRLATPVIPLSALRNTGAASLPLEKSIVPVRVNGTEFSALIDTGSTSSFIDSKVVRYMGIPVKPQNNCITLASSNSMVKSLEVADIVKFEMGEFTYTNLGLSVLPELCCDILIGHDVLSQHGSLIVDFGGCKKNLVVSNSSTQAVPPQICSVACADIEPPLLFNNLSNDCKPVACKSRRYSDEDLTFIRGELEKLLESNIIEPCHSPWRAQVLVTRDEHHKKRMVIDYS